MLFYALETVQQDVKLRIVCVKDYVLNRKSGVPLAAKINYVSG